MLIRCSVVLGATASNWDRVLVVIVNQHHLGRQRMLGRIGSTPSWWVTP